MLALNHRQAAQALWAKPALTLDNVCQWHALLTSDHGLEEVAKSVQFLPEHQRGQPRENEDVNLGSSAYLPPFRPGTGYMPNRCGASWSRPTPCTRCRRRCT